MMGINFGIGYGLYISLLAAIGGVIAAVAPMILESRGSTSLDASILTHYSSTDPGVLSVHEIAEMKARGPAGLDAAIGGGYLQQQPAMGPSGPMEPTGAAGPIGPMASMGATGASRAGFTPTGTATEHFNRASDLEAMGEHDKAMIEYSKAIAADESHVMSYFNRGSLYMQQGKTADAIIDFEKVIQRSDNPDLQRMAQLRIEEITR
jgi:tetratricopeptide (TPR) repeat protein